MRDDHRYWFIPRAFGYGVTPIAWRGWALVGGLAVPLLMLAMAGLVLPPRALPIAIGLTVSVLLIYSGAMIAVARRHTRGDWRWRWGGRD